jgi:hypothetical protein
MSLTKQGNFTFSHASQQNDLYNVYSATQIKQHFDSRADELKTTINAIIDQLQAITDGDSGADNVKATAVLDLTGSTVQALIESIRDTLKATTDGASGADFVNSTSITGVTGSTVQAQLESLKTLIDAVYTKAQLDGGQLDNRYFTEVEIQSTTDTNSGADKVGATEVAIGSGTTVQLILEWLYQEIVNVTLGQIPDGSLTDVKLSNDPADIKARFMDFLGNANSQTAVIPHGLSAIETDQKTPLDIAMDGRTLVNHMGWQGKFGSLFNRWNANLTIDTSVYKFGTSSGKIDNSAGTAEKTSDNSQKMYLNGKYILLGVWAKAVSGTPNIDVYALGRNADNTISDTTKNIKTNIDATWKFYWSKFDLTASTDAYWTSRLDVNSYGTANDVINFDGMITMPLTQAQYDEIDILTSDEVAEKYGYVDSVKHIQNPVVVSYGKNLLPPFTEWTLHANATVIEPYKLELNATANYQQSYVDAPVIEGQTYTASIIESVGRVVGQWFDKNMSSLSGNFTLTTATAPTDARYLRVIVDNGTSTGVITFTNPQLELGSVATSFEAQNKTYLYGKDVKLGSNLDGSVADQLLDRNSMLKRFELDMVMDGSLGWTFRADRAGYKEVKLAMNNSVANTGAMSKYDGKIIGRDTTPTDVLVDHHFLDSANLFISIPDTDSGWTDAMTPTANMIKGYFNGWKYTGDGTTHSWAQINDATITSTSDTFVADPANSHADWTPYELSYQLADSVVEPVTMEGDLTLIEGLNQIEVSSGLINREPTIPKLHTNDLYHINHPTVNTELLEHRTDTIIKVYKDGKEDELWTITKTGSGQAYAYLNKADFDTTAQYTVTYLVLDKHLFTANAIEAEGTYQTNLKKVVEILIDKNADHATQLSQQDIWNDNVAVKGEGEVVQSDDSTVSVSASTNGNVNVTFKRAFSKIPKVIVVVTGGYSAYHAVTSNVTTTGFTITVRHVDGTSATFNVPVDWLAIGK